ncbi:hypothetical protein BaRGS_00002307, partial [Batillaria attramentaria]
DGGIDPEQRQPDNSVCSFESSGGRRAPKSITPPVLQAGSAGSSVKDQHESPTIENALNRRANIRPQKAFMGPEIPGTWPGRFCWLPSRFEASQDPAGHRNAHLMT